MATYAYRCPDCGPFEVRLPIGTAEAVTDCPGCRSAARRVFTAPSLARLSPATSAAFTREEQSRETPEVVTRVPAERRWRTPQHPALSRLPRP
ncbi:FmdB family zinc ribbon protein [Nonomuraea sp. NPDC049714]|uniref:FmdB family zinc ribbon protein n=1 Tax=Nonomuraea sp. NPDC049714 TaxID=3364357 RepID=UPI0037973C5A